MKRIVLPLLLAGAMIAPAFADDVTVTIKGVKARGGDVLVSLQTEDEFLQPKGHYGAIAKAPVKDGEVKVTIPGVAPGAYSLSVLHDENGDRQMAMQPSGMPAEGWTMLNAAGLRARPTFAETSFTVGKAPVALTVEMLYPQK